MRAELDGMMAAVEDAVAACIRLRRWDDLEAAVTEYSALMGVNPCLLLFSAIVRPLARHALTLTDPTHLAEFAIHVRSAIELANSGWSLHQAIDFMGDCARHKDALRTFESLGESQPATLH